MNIIFISLFFGRVLHPPNLSAYGPCYMILVAFETSSGDHKLVTEHEAQ